MTIRKPIQPIMDKESLRPLGRLELFHHIRSKLGFYNNVSLTAQYAMPSGVLEVLGGMEVVIYAALKRIICTQPIMGVSVVDDGPQSASWIRLNKVDLKAVTKFITIPSSQQFIEDEHQKPFERLGEHPLWRVVIAEHRNDSAGSSAPRPLSADSRDIVFEVGFFYSHAIGDGLSGAAFHLDFLDALNGLMVEMKSSESPLGPVVEVPKLELLPNLERAAHFPLSIMFIGWEIMKEFVLGDKDPGRWTGPSVMFSPEMSRKTRMITIILPSATSTKISARCRQNEATVTPLLTVLIARHLAKAYPTHSRFRATVAIQLRRFTGVSNRQMVDQVSGVSVPCSTKGEKGHVSCSLVDWEVVRACRAIIDGAAKSPWNQITTMLKFLRNFEGFFRSKVGQERSWSFEVSNVGVVDGCLHGDGTVKLRRLVFSQSANITGAPYVFSVASVKGGDMAIALTWQEGILEEAKASKIMEDLNNELHLMAMELDLEDFNSVIEQ